MSDDTKHLKQPNWGRDRGKNTRRNRSQRHEYIRVNGHYRNGNYVKPFYRKPPKRR